MTKANGKPCTRCGTSEWDNNYECIQCRRARNKIYKQKNKDKRREQAKRYEAKYPEKLRAKRRRYEANNRAKMTAKIHVRRERQHQSGGSYTAYEWKSLCNQYDNRCLRCGKKTKLTADHIIPVSMGGNSDISNIQPLCKPCNSKKGTKTTDYRTKTGILRWIQDKLL